jgi:hypothetical protein
MIALYAIIFNKQSRAGSRAVDVGVFTAQLRNHIESGSKMAKAGVLYLPPALPVSQTKKLSRGLASAAQIVEEVLTRLIEAKIE